MITNTNVIVYMLVCECDAKQVPDIVALHCLVNKCSEQVLELFLGSISEHISEQF